MGAGARTCRARTFAFGTRSLAAAISFGALQRSYVPTAGASGTMSRRPVSASNATACNRGEVSYTAGLQRAQRL